MNNDGRGALGGILATAFDGQWISPPEASDRVADKVYRLGGREPRPPTRSARS
ncbi:hypothetical protein [Streptomyces sp. NPDC006971]|uniref:hypothetical protein n=1 Tax=Streptomyces sp. NPDC006971 TaxID=3154784 RepID=UPI0033E6A9F2